MNNAKKIILSRALTNSGDQAWDFAVPVALAMAMPGKLEIVALVFFLSKLSHVLLLPTVGSLIDRLSRIQAFRIGLIAQFLGVGMQTVALALLSQTSHVALVGIVLGGILSSLGASMTSIGVAQDLVPTLFKGDLLTKINSRIRQVDLFSEVVSPVLAGLMLALTPHSFPLLGLVLIAGWNLISFFPEYVLLKNVLVFHRDLLRKPPLALVKTPIWEKLSHGWKELLRLSIAPAVFAYAFLWLSVLSPHGVLLTSFLKETWKLPEFTLGVFRGAGAIFGLAATFIFPFLVRSFGLTKAAALSIVFQASSVCIALIGFHKHNEIVFLGFILLSRIGLYSFSLGEQQIRQIGIPERSRGVVNATASAMTGIATLCLFGLGSILGSVDQFQKLVDISVAFVALGALTFCIKIKTYKSIT